MEFSINHTRQPEDPKSGLVKIGWFFADDTSSVVYFPPKRSRTVDMNRTHAKSASRCPAVIGLESRYMMVRCPFDLHIGFIKDDNSSTEYFVHVTGLVDQIEEGDQVQYELKEGKKGLNAVNVTQL